jgi:hypothetical protein
MRWVRLGFAFFFVYSGIYNQGFIFYCFWIVLLFQALFNSGCGAKGCAMPINKKTKK